MNDQNSLAERNLSALERVSGYLTSRPRFITSADVAELTAAGVTEDEAVYYLFCAACGLSHENAAERALAEDYLQPALKRLSAERYRQNDYYRLIRFPEASRGRWRLTHLRYAPYELFPCGDLVALPDGRELTPLGYFGDAFSYPAVLENGREWMTVTPNEIETMAGALAAARGDVTAMGLGLAYFAFMASQKPAVSSVTVVERDADVIALFKEFLIGQFPHREKIRIVQADAFDYAQNALPAARADFAFVDLWHDVSDGVEPYLRMKRLAPLSPHTAFAYWIEPALLAFLRALASEDARDPQ